MTKNPSELYQRLEKALIDGRSAGSLTQEDDDGISEDMAMVWLEMDRTEREAARLRVADYARGLVARKNAVNAKYIVSNSHEIVNTITPPRVLITVANSNYFSNHVNLNNNGYLFANIIIQDKPKARSASDCCIEMQAHA